MSVTVELSATAVTSSSATTRGSLAPALSPWRAGRLLSSTSSFMPSANPCARPPSRYATPSATYFTLKTVRKPGSSLRAITVRAGAVGAAASGAVAVAAGVDDSGSGSAAAVEDRFATGVEGAGAAGAAVSREGNDSPAEVWPEELAGFATAI